MIFTYIIAMLLVLILLMTWIFVQHMARQYSARHPEFDAANEQRSGCGLSCGCLGTLDGLQNKKPEQCLRNYTHKHEHFNQ